MSDSEPKFAIISVSIRFSFTLKYLVIKSDNIVVSIKEDNFERFNYYILKFVPEQKVFHTF